MAYFTAVLARTGTGWRVRDVEIEHGSSLEDLGDTLRGVAIDDLPVLALVELEDEWFALVRADADDEPRVFVSDAEAMAASPFGSLLDDAPGDDGDEPETVPDPDAEDGPASAEDTSARGEGGGGSGGSGEDAPASDVPPSRGPGWAGDPDLLTDVGLDADRVRDLVERHGDDPGAVIAEVAEALGVATELEVLR